MTSILTILDNSLNGPIREYLLKHISKLTKLFSAYAAARPFEFLIMHNAPTVIGTFIQICQHEAKEFNKPAEETDEMKLSVLSKVVINAVSSIRSILKVVSDPKVIEKGNCPFTIKRTRSSYLSMFSRSYTMTSLIRNDFLFIRDFLPSYSGSRVILEEEKGREEQVAVANSTLDTIFNPTTVLELAAVLWSNFLILRHCDQEAWEEDPEAWFLEVSGEVVSADIGFRVFSSW